VAGDSGKGVVRDVGGLNRFTGGLGDQVLVVGASYLGDGVAVLHLHGDNLDLGVVNTVLGGDLAAGVLHGGDGRVGHGVSNRGYYGAMEGSRSSSMVGGYATVEESSIGVSFSLCLRASLSPVKRVGDRGVTDGVDNILAHLLVLDLLGVNGLGGALLLGAGHTSLSCQHLVLSLAVGGRHVVSSGSRGQGSSCQGGMDRRSGSNWAMGQRSGSDGAMGQRSGSSYGAMTMRQSRSRMGSKEKLGVSLGLSLGVGGGGSLAGNSKEENSEKLCVHVEIILTLPTRVSS